MNRTISYAYLAIMLCHAGTTLHAHETTNRVSTSPAHVQFAQRFVSTTRRDTETINADLAIDPFPSCRGTLKGVKIRLTSNVNPLFAGTLLVPGIAGVNANLTVNYSLRPPMADPVKGSLFFNGSETFTQNKPTIAIDYSPSSLDTGFHSLPAAAVAKFLEGGMVSFPITIDCEQESTVSNTGMLAQFETDIDLTVDVAFEFTAPELPPFGCKLRSTNDGQLLLEWSSRKCAEYVIQGSPSVTPSSWVSLAKVTATGPVSSVSFPSEGSSALRYFRIVGTP